MKATTLIETEQRGGSKWKTQGANEDGSGGRGREVEVEADEGRLMRMGVVEVEDEKWKCKWMRGEQTGDQESAR